MTGRDAARTFSVAELEGEIARTRARLSHGLAVLDREYALRHLLVRGTRLVRGAEFQPGIIAAMMRREILPLALVSAGLVWLVLGRKEGGHLLGRLSQGLVHIQSLAEELLPLLRGSRAVPESSLADAGNHSAEANSTAHPDS